MSGPLMPKATAVWLLDNTALTFQQIADFCRLHILEVETLANDESGVTPVGLDPILNGQLTKEEIALSTEDPARPLRMTSAPATEKRRKGARYTPLAQRQDRPNAIAWLVKNHPELSDGQIIRLVGTTKTTIAAIRDRTHWNIQNIKPHSPVLLGICSQSHLDDLKADALKRAANAEKKKVNKPAKPKK